MAMGSISAASASGLMSESIGLPASPVARLFVPADHAFVVAGTIRTEAFIEGSDPGLAERCPPPAVWADLPLAQLGLLHEDQDAAVIIRRLRRRVA